MANINRAKDKTVTATVRGKFKDDYSSGLGKFERSTKSAMKSLKKQAMAVGAAAAVVTAYVMAIKNLVDAYAKQEEAEIRVSSALKTTGQNAAVLTEKYRLLAAQIQSTTSRGDEEILAVMETLIRFGNVTEENMHRAVMATLNYARATGKNLQSAAFDLSKAFAGNVMMLQRYGIAVSKAEVEERGMVAVLEALEKKLDDTEAAYTRSIGGGMKQLSNVYGDIKEDLGHIIVLTGRHAKILANLDGDRPGLGFLNTIHRVLGGINSYMKETTRLYDELKAKDAGISAGASGVWKRNVDFVPYHKQTKEELEKAAEQRFTESVKAEVAAVSELNSKLMTTIELLRIKSDQTVNGIAAMPGVDMGVNPMEGFTSGVDITTTADVWSSALNEMSSSMEQFTSRLSESTARQFQAFKIMEEAIKRRKTLTLSDVEAQQYWAQAGVAAAMMLAGGNVKAMKIISTVAMVYELAMAYATWFLNPAQSATHLMSAAQYAIVAGSSAAAGSYSSGSGYPAADPSSGGGYYNGSGPSGSVPANAIAGGGSKTLNIKFVGLFDQKHIASALDTEEGEQVIVGRMINNAAREGDASDVFQVKI